MPIALFGKKSDPNFADIEAAARRITRRLGEELVVEDTENPKLKMSGAIPTEANGMVVCHVTRQNDELAAKVCLPVANVSEIERAIEEATRSGRQRQ